jgi:hypothetical protein
MSHVDRRLTVAEAGGDEMYGDSRQQQCGRVQVA